VGSAWSERLIVDSPPPPGATVPLQVRSKAAIEVLGGGWKVHCPPAPSGWPEEPSNRPTMPCPAPHSLVSDRDCVPGRALGCQP
jgi:hypothetical protein